MLMTLVAVVVSSVVSVADVPSPRPTAWVTDQADVLDADTEARLDAIATDLHARRGIELAIVTVDDVRETPKQFATALFNHWGIGSAATNNGVLVLLVMSKRRLEVETGRGIEGALPAAWLAEMQARDMVPRFKARQFGLGLIAGVTAIADHLGAAPGESTSGAPAGEYRSDGAVRQPATTTRPLRSDDRPGSSDDRPATTRTGTAGTPADDDDDGVPPLPFALGGLALVGGGGTALTVWVRRKRRTCDHCTPPRRMIALDEVADDAHLDDGQRTEERIGSVDYEVLICGGCQASRTIRHGRWFSGYGKCAQCSYKTMKSSSTTLLQATYDHGGQVEVTEQCQKCGYHHSYTRSTAQLTRSDSSGASSWGSSSSSSSSSSGSSGFSGGSSGGGGAGSSW